MRTAVSNGAKEIDVYMAVPDSQESTVRTRSAISTAEPDIDAARPEVTDQTAPADELSHGESDNARAGAQKMALILMGASSAFMTIALAGAVWLLL